MAAALDDCSHVFEQAKILDNASPPDGSSLGISMFGYMFYPANSAKSFLKHIPNDNIYPMMAVFELRENAEHAKPEIPHIRNGNHWVYVLGWFSEGLC